MPVAGALVERRQRLASPRGIAHDGGECAQPASGEQARARLQTLLATASDWFWEQDEELRLSYYSGSDQDGLGPGPSASLGQRRWEMPGLVPGQPDDASWALHRQQLAEAH